MSARARMSRRFMPPESLSTGYIPFLREGNKRKERLCPFFGFFRWYVEIPGISEQVSLAREVRVEV